MERPKVASDIVTFAEVVKSNHQLSSKVGYVLIKLLHNRLDGDELFKRCKGLQEEKKDLASKVKGITMERDKLSKLIVELEAQLKGE